MYAVAFSPDDTSLRVVEKEWPTPADGEALVRTLAVGVDGSDRRIAAGEIGGDPPAGSDHLVLGHEAVGVVEESAGTLEAGSVVVPMVRRPASDSRFARNGELDMATPGTFHECGITGAHGFMSEAFVADPAYLIPVAESVADYGFLAEPASVVEKAIDQAFATRSRFDWRPETAFVLGNGNLGLLALARLTTGEEFDRTYCLGRRDRPDQTIQFIENVGGTYVDSREVPLVDFAETYEPADFIFETTGYSKHSVEAVRALGSNGVATLQGIPAADTTLEVDCGTFHTDLVTTNKALLGVVNARKSHFQSAIEWLADAPTDRLEELVTGIYDPDEVEQAFDDSPEKMKTVVKFDQ